MESNRFRLSRKKAAFVVSLAFVLCMFVIHMSSLSDSMLNEKNHVISNGFLTSQINYHKELAPFARRPLTTMLIETAASLTRMSLGKAFVWVNMGLLFLSGLLLFRLSAKLRNDYRYALTDMVAYFLTFPVIFAFFPPIFSYDEPLQYCFLFAALTAIVQQRWIGYVVWFSLAIVARENSIFLLPGLALVFPLQKDTKATSFFSLPVRHLAILGIPLVCYALFLLIYGRMHDLWEPTKLEFGSRFTCFAANFQNQERSTESLFAIFLTLGPFLYFLWNFVRQFPVSLTQKKFINAFIITCLINIPVVLTAAFAREARLFALPLFFLWPWASDFIGRQIRPMRSLRNYLRCFKDWRYGLALPVWGLINYLIAFDLYIPSFPGSDNFFNEYLFVLLEFVSLHFLMNHHSANHREHPADEFDGIPEA